MTMPAYVPARRDTISDARRQADRPYNGPAVCTGSRVARLVVLLASDASHFYESFEKTRPFPLVSILGT
jgi:hypothetical protein